MGKIVGGGKPRAALAKLTKLAHKYKRQGFAVLITGHSLGGYMAEIASTHLNLPGIGFNAEGSSKPWYGNHTNPNFQIVNAWEDAVGNINSQHWKHAKEPIYVDTHSHYLDVTVDRLESLDDGT